MEVTKRDGRHAEFNKHKIKESVLKAFLEVDGDISHYANNKASEIASYVEGILSEHEYLNVEDIQNIVEEKLMASNRKDVARAYIIYRSTRSRIRERNSAWMKAIKEKLSAVNVQNQNANVDEKSFGGRKGEADSELLRKIALDDLMSEMSRNNHLNNEIYVHDLNDYVLGDHNCLTCPVDELLEKGFNVRQTDIRPAQSVNTAFQLLAVIFQVQSLQQFGGISEGHLDHTMVPYVRKSFLSHYKDGLRYISKNENTIDLDKNNVVNVSIDDKALFNDSAAYKYAIDMTEREIYQGAEGMFHNLNSLQSRSGNQLPFSSINYGTCTLTEGRMITKAILKVSINGIGKLHRTPIFPCGIFQYMKGINDKPGTPNYDLYRLALKSTALRLYPNYCNVDWSNNAGYDRNDPRTYMSTMGKRKLQLM